MPEPGALLSKPLALDLQALNRERRRTPIPPPRTPPLRDLSGRPPVRGILLADLIDGGAADAAITVPETTNEVQQIEIVGNPVQGGSFTLQFKGQTTTPLPFNATASQMQTALQALSTIGQGNCTVDLGKQKYTNAVSGNQATEFPGVWLVNFTGQLAGQSNLPLLVPSPQIGGLLGGPAVMVAETTNWADAGHVETFNDVIPVGTPTPMHAGAVAVAIWFPGFGYGVIACEARQFAVTYY